MNTLIVAALIGLFLLGLAVIAVIFVAPNPRTCRKGHDKSLETPETEVEAADRTEAKDREAVER